MTIPARYENGVFRPLEAVQIKEGTVVDVNLPVAGDQRPKSVRDLGAFGMWADRDDITDAVSYVDALRNSPRS